MNEEDLSALKYLASNSVKHGVDHFGPLYFDPTNLNTNLFSSSHTAVQVSINEERCGLVGNYFHKSPLFLSVVKNAYFASHSYPNHYKVNKNNLLNTKLKIFLLTNPKFVDYILSEDIETLLTPNSSVVAFLDKKIVKFLNNQLQPLNACNFYDKIYETFIAETTNLNEDKLLENIKFIFFDTLTTDNFFIKDFLGDNNV